MREQNIPHEGSAVAPYVTISVGVASIAELPKSVATLSRDSATPAMSSGGGTVLVETADHALYQAKLAGRNRAVAAGAADAAPEIAQPCNAA